MHIIRLNINKTEREIKMKKLSIMLMLVMFSILLLAACGGSDTPSIPQDDPNIIEDENPPLAADPTPPENIDPIPPIDIASVPVAYYRIDWNDDMDGSVIIKSAQELEKFFEDLKAANYNELNEDLVVRFTGGLYDDSFFADNYLVLITVAENSGSNRHALSDISIEDNELHINIDRELPEMGTADMAGWLIIIELGNIYPADKTNVIFTDVTVSE